MNNTGGSKPLDPMIDSTSWGGEYGNIPTVSIKKFLNHLIWKLCILQHLSPKLAETLIGWGGHIGG